MGLEPSPEFYQAGEISTSNGVWSGLLPYLSPYKRLIIQFMIGILVGLVFQVMFPFLTQSLIDVGVQNQNLSFVTLILFAQLVLFVSQTFVQFIQSWIILQIGKRVNVSLISDFLIRLMRLPLGYFDSKNVGDLIQRIEDNDRVESFLTGSVLSIFFSFLSVVVFSGILAIYDLLIFGVFLGFTILYISWVMIFMKRRRPGLPSFSAASDISIARDDQWYAEISCRCERSVDGVDRYTCIIVQVRQSLLPFVSNKISEPYF